jgi:hypothetical protein
MSRQLCLRFDAPSAPPKHCAECNEKPVPNRARCQKHLERAVMYTCARYRARVAQHICTQCGKAEATDGIQCAPCKAVSNARGNVQRKAAASRRAERKAAGLCPSCGIPKPDPLCKPCVRKSVAQWRQKQRLAKVA